MTEHLRVDGAGTDADRADAVRLALGCDCLGQADDSVLGDVVRGEARKLLGRVHAGKGRDVDDPSFAGGPHRGKCRATTQERARQIDRERLLPDLRGGFSKRRGCQHTRRADQCRGRTSRRGGYKEPLDVADLADVGRCRSRLAAGVSDASGDGVESLVIAGG